MDLFRYPKGTHVRALRPRQFKRYQTYKRWLQREFGRVCVYCREPDSTSRNLNYQVDHYRPKSIPRFAQLLCAYSNLYYCCVSCNSRKSADWPKDETAGPYVVNPCDHNLADHLRFNARTGEVDARTNWGEHTRNLLQLNEPQTVALRRSTQLNVRLCEQEIVALAAQRTALDKKLRQRVMSAVDHGAEVAEIDADLRLAQDTLDALTGMTPLPPLPSRRLGVTL